MKTYNISLFYNFLKSKGLWENYKRYRREEKTKVTKFIIEEPECWISYAFYWDESYEQYNFWDDIHWEWNKLLDNHVKQHTQK